MLKPLQEELEEKRFKEQLLLDASKVISYHNNNMAAEADNSADTFSNSDLDSMTQQSALFKQLNQSKKSGLRRYTDIKLISSAESFEYERSE